MNAIAQSSIKGRKRQDESRADEFRQRLLAWKQNPESLRPSLRALARELGTSHQLLQHYLNGLEEWEARVRYQRAKERAVERSKQIRARAAAENREMTMRECLDAIVVPEVLDQIEDMRQRAKRGPLHSAEFKILKLWASQGFPGAQELLQRRAQIGTKEKKRFSQIVKETPHQEGETHADWIRRILDQCSKYETDTPTVISVELLEKWSRSTRTIGME